MDVYNHAFGPCAVCSKDCEEVSEFWDPAEQKMMPGSLYWTPLPDSVWNTVRPFLAPHFPEGMVSNVLYIPPHSKPFCSAACSLSYHNGCGSLNDGEGKEPE
jgi:hypothetical protein